MFFKKKPKVDPLTCDIPGIDNNLLKTEINQEKNKRRVEGDPNPLNDPSLAEYPLTSKEAK